MKKLFVGVLLSALIPSSSSAIDWRQHDGREVNMICMTITWCVALQEQLPKFSAKTGITVNLDLFEDATASYFDLVEFSRVFVHALPGDLEMGSLIVGRILFAPEQMQCVVTFEFLE